jgi:hypothetical protein
MLLQVVELTASGLAFFSEAFRTFDRNGDGLLSPSEQEEMFATAPSRCARSTRQNCQTLRGPACGRRHRPHPPRDRQTGEAIRNQETW